MGTCGNCHYWDPTEYPGELHIQEIGKCCKAMQVWDATEWVESNDGPERATKKEVEDTSMFVQDASDYMATLYTRPTFSCAHWTEKEVD